MVVTIRESKESDKDSIRDVHLSAFGEPEGASVSRLTLELVPGVLAGTRGPVRCASCLHSPEHW